MIVEAAATLAGVLGLRALAHRAILHGLRAPRVPHALRETDLPVAADDVREVWIDGERGRRLFAWLVMPPGATRPVPAVLVLHGWGSNAEMMWPVVPPLQAAGFAVLLLEARCHGRSDAERFTSMPRFAEDIASGLAWLRRRPGIASDRIALLGHSVGAAACLLHASRCEGVRAVVSLSTFAHPEEVMRRFMAGKRLPYPVLGWYVLRHVQRVIGSRFEAIAPLRTIARVTCPVLLVHGLHDHTVPFDDARRLLAAAHDAQLLPVQGDHDLRAALQPHGGMLVDFLLRAVDAPLPDPPGGRRLPTPAPTHPHPEPACP